jgi:hypothetical protein
MKSDIEKFETDKWRVRTANILGINTVFPFYARAAHIRELAANRKLQKESPFWVKGELLKVYEAAS